MSVVTTKKVAPTQKIVKLEDSPEIIDDIQKNHTPISEISKPKISEGITKRSVNTEDSVKNEVKIESLLTMESKTEKTTSESNLDPASTSADSSSTSADSSTTSGTSVNTETTEPEKESQNQILRKWDGKKKIVFLHIGKNGGTSFDKLMSGTVKATIFKIQ